MRAMDIVHIQILLDSLIYHSTGLRSNVFMNFVRYGQKTETKNKTKKKKNCDRIHSVVR
jgi:hypothetical protein